MYFLLHLKSIEKKRKEKKRKGKNGKEKDGLLKHYLPFCNLKRDHP
jgi:hypothetical protein